MDFIPSCDFNICCPVLLNRVAQYEGFGISFWITKCIMLTNESGVDVVRHICHSVSAKLAIDSNGLSLDNGCIVVQIAQSLLEEEVP